MEQAVSRANMMAAYVRVVGNEGAAGVDQMTVVDLKPFLVDHWRRIKEDLLADRYQPQTVRGVEIPKPAIVLRLRAGGGVRLLGIPTVADRLIQQALHQVLMPLFDPGFSAHSYGFRPGRSAHDAVKAAKAHVAGGKRVVVDMDLEKFFDRVNHDVLMARVAQGRGCQGVAAHSPLSAGWVDVGRGDDGPAGGHAAGWAAIAAVVEYPARRSGQGAGTAGALLLPICGRLQHLCCVEARR
jgi:RNA-directed DNA polymerase